MTPRTSVAALMALGALAFAQACPASTVTTLSASRLAVGPVLAGGGVAWADLGGAVRFRRPGGRTFTADRPGAPVLVLAGSPAGVAVLGGAVRQVSVGAAVGPLKPVNTFSGCEGEAGTVSPAGVDVSGDTIAWVERCAGQTTESIMTSTFAAAPDGAVLATPSAASSVFNLRAAGGRFAYAVDAASSGGVDIQLLGPAGPAMTLGTLSSGRSSSAYEDFDLAPDGTVAVSVVSDESDAYDVGIVILRAGRANRVLKARSDVFNGVRYGTVRFATPSTLVVAREGHAPRVFDVASGRSRVLAGGRGTGGVDADARHVAWAQRTGKSLVRLRLDALVKP